MCGTVGAPACGQCQTAPPIPLFLYSPRLQQGWPASLLAGCHLAVKPCIKKTFAQICQIHWILYS